MVTLVWGFTSHALDKQLTFSAGDLVQVNSPTGNGLFGYKNFSATPNGSGAVKVFAENAKLRVLESKVIPATNTSWVWVLVVPAELGDAAAADGLWIIGATVPGTGFPYVTKSPGGA